jgi:hypothetical protein
MSTEDAIVRSFVMKPFTVGVGATPLGVQFEARVLFYMTDWVRRKQQLGNVMFSEFKRQFQQLCRQLSRQAYGALAQRAWERTRKQTVTGSLAQYIMQHVQTVLSPRVARPGGSSRAASARCHAYSCEEDDDCAFAHFVSRTRAVEPARRAVRREA